MPGIQLQLGLSSWSDPCDAADPERGCRLPDSSRDQRLVRMPTTDLYF
jgi:hypothetical protein